MTATQFSRLLEQMDLARTGQGEEATRWKAWAAAMLPEKSATPLTAAR